MNQLLVRTEKCVGCKTCELACSITHSRSKDLVGAFLSGERPVRRVTVETNPERTINLPVQCRQCQDPKCVHACMTGAMYLDAGTGLVLNRKEKCVGCWMCVMVCPYGVITPSEEHKVAVKCDQCLSEGHDPACVKSCPTKALSFMPIGAFDKTVKKAFLSKFISGEEV
ncbi:4Fe-4S dicluster domain-containing protein [Candidatus Formimonas warabiya]|uniref:4Fe-4S dicluster domain-containing protein n=1 Tax=Formimonas warabiya TaxID=1761012 RepID=UPI0011D0A225|nr:4Fe-4S dicluster domain-containing protein [Candidatus Formimonas warabiya]